LAKVVRPAVSGRQRSYGSTRLVNAALEETQIRKVRTVSAIVLVIATIGAAGIAGCRFASDIFHNRAIPSPDGRLIADYYTISGGGGAGWSEDYVRIRRAGQPFRASRWDLSLLSSDAVFKASSGKKLMIRWRSNTHLEITYSGHDGVFRSRPSWNNISIVYNENP
jgi:hypothetical protein